MGCEGSKAATVSKPAVHQEIGSTLLQGPMSPKQSQESLPINSRSQDISATVVGACSESVQVVGFTDVVEVPLGKGNTAKVADWLLNDANGLKYTCAQKGNISATGNVYTTEEGVEMIAFFGEWESKEDFDAYFHSEGRTNDSWKELCTLFAGPPKVTAMTPMSGRSVVKSDASRAPKHLVVFTDLVEVPLVAGSTAKVVDWMLNDPNGLKYTCAQPGNLSATGNVYTTSEGVETAVFFGEWASKGDFDAYFASEGRTNASWKEFCKSFAGPPKVTPMTPMEFYRFMWSN